jgi:hypothetical protein
MTRMKLVAPGHPTRRPTERGTRLHAELSSKSQTSTDGVALTWEAQPAPYSPEPRAEGAVHIPSQVTPPGGPEIASGGAAWVEPVGDTCPSSHPVKAKMTSRIFHVAGGVNYTRTRPDRCYRDADAAKADGLRRAAR